MADEELPEDVRDFLYENVESYEQLAILLLLHTHSNKQLDLGTVTRDTRLPMELAAQALDELCAKGLAKRSGAGDSFVLDVGKSETVARLAALYETQPLEIMSAMNANAIQRLRSSMMKSFSNAFIVSRKKKDG